VSTDRPLSSIEAFALALVEASSRLGASDGGDHGEGRTPTGEHDAAAAAD
jgi:hypothetical protein